MQRDEIARLEHLVDAARAPHLRRQAPGGIHRDLRVVAEHVHAQPDRRVGHQAADLAQADDAQRVARQLDAGEGLLARFDALAEIRRRGVERAHEIQRSAEVARRHQHAGEHQFLHRIGVGARRVEHRDAACRELRHRDVVDAGAGAADRLQALAEGIVVQVARAQQDDVGRRGLVDHRVALARQGLQAGRRHLIEDQDFGLARHGVSHGAPRSPACTRPARRTPSIGMAL